MADVMHPPALPRSRRSGGSKIALFTGNYNYLREGANQALNRLVAHLEQHAGARVRVYSPVTATPAFEPAGTLVAVRSITLPMRGEFRLALGLPRSIRNDLHAFRPDLILAATPDIMGFRALSYARERNIPAVASLHTRFETVPAYYGLGLLRPVVERLLDRFYRRSDLILVPTDALVREFAGKYPGTPVRRWGRGVDTELFAPSRRSPELRAQWGLGPEDVAILFFGRLVLEKGIEVFGDVVKGLGDEGHPIRPVFVGEGPARAVAEQGLPGAVFTGHLAGAELARAVASCDILFNPSEIETFGNVIAEAMACGLAVVAAEVPSTRNLIQHGHNGVMSGPEGYADSVRVLILDPARRRAIGTAARETGLGLEWGPILDAVADALNELIDARAPA